MYQFSLFDQYTGCHKTKLSTLPKKKKKHTKLKGCGFNIVYWFFSKYSMHYNSPVQKKNAYTQKKKYINKIEEGYIPLPYIKFICDVIIRIKFKKMSFVANGVNHIVNLYKIAMWKLTFCK